MVRRIFWEAMADGAFAPSAACGKADETLPVVTIVDRETLAASSLE